MDVSVIQRTECWDVREEAHGELAAVVRRGARGRGADETSRQRDEHPRRSPSSLGGRLRAASENATRDARGDSVVSRKNRILGVEMRARIVQESPLDRGAEQNLEPAPLALVEH